MRLCDVNRRPPDDRSGDAPAVFAARPHSVVACPPTGAIVEADDCGSPCSTSTMALIRPRRGRGRRRPTMSAIRRRPALPSLPRDQCEQAVYCLNAAETPRTLEQHSLSRGRASEALAPGRRIGTATATERTNISSPSARDPPPTAPLVRSPQTRPSWAAAGAALCPVGRRDHLQQTRVETVLDYYERFCDVSPRSATSPTPTIRTCSIWEGLGYRRILHLHRAPIHSRRRPERFRDIRRRGPCPASATHRRRHRLDRLQRTGRRRGRQRRPRPRPTLAIDDDIRAPRPKRISRNRAGLALAEATRRLNQAWMDPAAASAPKSACRSARASLCAQRVSPTHSPPSLPRVNPQNSTRVSIFMHDRKMLVRHLARGGLVRLWEFPTIECVGRAAPSGLVRQPCMWKRRRSAAREGRRGYASSPPLAEAHVFAIPVATLRIREEELIDDG